MNEDLDDINKDNRNKQEDLYNKFLINNKLQVVINNINFITNSLTIYQSKYFTIN